MRKLVLILSVILIPIGAQAQSVESHLTASNGVEVTLHSDDFADRYEYTGPTIFFMAEGTGLRSFALVARIREGGVLSPLQIIGSIYYEGDWRRYSRAIFRGGDPADFSEAGREVVTCRGGCSYREGFQITLFAEDVTAHSENGYVLIQVRAAASPDTALIQIPISQIDAVNEIAATGES
jgi:hypothetical protein